MRSDDSYDALGEETVKRISTERSLPHDNVIVEGRFLRTWGVDIRSMLIKPREIERAGRREEKKLNKPPGHETTGAQSQGISWNRSEKLSNVSIISGRTDPHHS